MASSTTTTKKLSDLLKHVDTHELVLPEIQRDFVWTKKSVLLLFDSLFRGLPIGHMLVWKAKKPVPVKGKGKLDFHSFYGYLLDGQQRLTALQRVRDADDSFRLMFYTWPRRDDEGNDFFAWQSNWTISNEWYVDVAQVLRGEFVVLKYLDTIKKNEYFEKGMENKIHEELMQLSDILKRDIGVIEFETDDYRQATELFIRFNSTGRKLGKSDLLVAELAVNVPGLTSDEVHILAHKWPGFSFTVPFLVQCLLAVNSGRLETKRAQVTWGRTTPAEIRKSWSLTARGLSHVIAFLTGTVRWKSSDLIPSFNALIPLVVVAANRDGFTERERALARRWLLLASVRGLFSGSTYTELNRILKHLQKEESVQELWKATSTKLKKLRSEDFEVSRISGPITSLFLSMLADNDARDWKSKDFKLDGQVHGHGARLQVHHFFPRSLLRKHDIGQDRINTFANYTVISSATNLDVGVEEPGTYMKRLDVPVEQLEIQCIPRDRDLWRVGRYEEFLEEREKLLAAAANKFLGM
jgi:hypothetical protein